MPENEAGTTLEPMARELLKLRDRVADLDAHLKDLKVKEKQCESSLIQIMSEEDLDSCRLESGLSITVKRTIFASCTNADMPDVEVWMKENDLLPEGLRTTINKALLNKEIRRRVDDGEEIPSCISFYIRESASIKN